MFLGLPDLDLTLRLIVLAFFGTTGLPDLVSCQHRSGYHQTHLPHFEFLGFHIDGLLRIEVHSLTGIED